MTPSERKLAMARVVAFLSRPEECCEWREDEYNGAWIANCGAAYCFEYDFRKHQYSYNFCPFCGRKIKVKT